MQKEIFSAQSKIVEQEVGDGNCLQYKYHDKEMLYLGY
jgi:hypothetical protein